MELGVAFPDVRVPQSWDNKMGRSELANGVQRIIEPGAPTLVVRLGSGGFACSLDPWWKGDGGNGIGAAGTSDMLDIDTSPLYKDAERLYIHGAREG